MVLIEAITSNKSEGHFVHPVVYCYDIQLHKILV